MYEMMMYLLYTMSLSTSTVGLVKTKRIQVNALEGGDQYTRLHVITMEAGVTLCIRVHKAFLHVYTFQVFNHSTSGQSEHVIMAGRSHSFNYCIRSRKLSLRNHPSSLLKMSLIEKLEILQ